MKAIQKNLFQLECLFYNYIDFALANKPLYLLMAHKTVERLVDENITGDAEAFAIFFKAEIERLIPIRKNSVEIDQIYKCMMSLVHGMICLCYASSKFSITERNFAIRTMINGFL